jgi:hypothetical protein
MNAAVLTTGVGARFIAPADRQLLPEAGRNQLRPYHKDFQAIAGLSDLDRNS